VQFGAPVSVQQADLSLRGVNVPSYATTAFGYDPATNTATWTLAAPLPADRVLLDHDGTTPDGVTATAGGPLLDGDWVNGVSAFPSGDGAAGGNLRFQLNVLPGDANLSGSVDAGDLVQVRNRGGTDTTSPGVAPNNYAIAADLNGSGAIDAADLVLTRNRGGASLVGVSAPTTAFALAAPASGSTFSSARIVGRDQNDLAALLA
jgi:hypothetical protein